MDDFIKSGDREKGPYSADMLRASFRDGALQRTTLVRAQDASEWVRLDEAVSLGASAPGGRSARGGDDGDAGIQAQMQREKKQRDVLVGGLICLAGVVVTFLSYASASGSGGGRYVVAWGAILFGAIRMFRGISS